LQQQPKPSQGEKDDEDEDQDEDDKPVDGAYNPLAYANLPVSGEIKELFEYINRFKP
jgi:intraflagellar transport protein 46